MLYRSRTTKKISNVQWYHRAHRGASFGWPFACSIHDLILQFVGFPSPLIVSHYNIHLIDYQQQWPHQWPATSQVRWGHSSWRYQLGRGHFPTHHHKKYHTQHESTSSSVASSARHCCSSSPKLTVAQSMSPNNSLISTSSPVVMRETVLCPSLGSVGEMTIRTPFIGSPDRL